MVVAGSSSVSPLMEKLAEAYLALNPNAEVEIQTSDSTAGLMGAVEGTWDLGMASRELKAHEAEQLESAVIAQDGIGDCEQRKPPQRVDLGTGEAYLHR